MTDYIPVRRADVEYLNEKISSGLKYQSNPFQHEVDKALCGRLSAALSAEPVVSEPRFYIDHGTIHDLVTGKHVVTDGTWPFEDTVEMVCDLLNSLNKRPITDVQAIKNLSDPPLAWLSPLKPASSDKLREAAQAVLDRWETPDWKDAEPTAHVMARLRQALSDPRTPHLTPRT